MGQKVNPIGLRVGVIRTWDSRWYAKGQQYYENLHEDIRLRKFLKDKLKNAGVAKIEMERAAKKIKIIISTARPGVVIGKKGSGIDALKAEVQKLTPNEVFLSIQEVRKPDLDAQLVAESIAQQLEKRISWRRALKKSIAAAIKGGVRGIKIRVSGRLDGAEIARSEWYNEKSVPLHTLRADIDYGTAESLTAYGIIGLKVWIYKGDILSAREVEEAGRVKS
ncbi:30S ribosomal protein S3 [Bdellovibrio bacteriovorus]|uniref:Small ribosomal subunit protein uS3 n=2 Tax=Bdellovibrio bacteriovorus TaxID=959 RepID=RS3_BDEBA|nr:30S ribosomal protein S3 [Bdellovibrio bacteriovorus]Q6MJ20.1 RecName: Full=Small ribosomal subunit protein uS3; AltName: Full=30S ribosomal protein S3 [Bdellovibrio bacteriovorus HD100]AFY02581.1 30S ribosomal protein S3 [Bdellovibrio bacteriovorus str. Tiberius]AHZ83370.1 30S ribosomal protein S3 [Bdellovibrio bacteriovorus]CAE80742.1 30S ribosomal protein S3 [Bdellovibrio bacteriovorus HD100]BEV69340.1 30S ribosomal protein S3 [Bdellovibrio bacteriovorus]